MISGVMPAAGPTAGGNSVVITGYDFAGVTGVSGVRFGGTNAVSYTVDNNNRITAVVPANTAGSTNITITAKGVVSPDNLSSQYTYIAAPTVTSISPTSGPTGGGRTVIITGTGFSAAPATGAVKFGATNATYTINSNTQITATSPANSAGVYDITVTTSGGTSATSAADQFTYVAAPTVTSISPTSGPSMGGTSVTITGTNFSGVTAVTFGATAASGFTVNSATQITATAPAGSAGTVDVRVTAGGGTSATSVADQFTYLAAPTVTSISPSSGPSTGGTSVTISGTNLSGVTAVTFGATAASDFTVNSATQITATAPAGSGTVDVRVTTAGGTSATSAADQFTYLPAPTVTSISPTSGPSTGGTSVIITGTNFSGVTAVTFGGTAASSLTYNGPTQITATAPAGTGTVDVRVTTGGGTSATSAADQFTYDGAPTVTSISPTSGPSTGGTSVTITGTNLSGATAVTFGATAASGFTVNSATQITATAPAGSAGTVDVRVTTAGGTSATSVADQFTYVGAPTVTSISPTAGPATGGTTVTLTGTNFTGATSVAFGATAATGFTVNSATQITATAPAGTGTVDIRVTTAGGTSATSVADQFTYVGAPSLTNLSQAVIYETPAVIDLSGAISGEYVSTAVATAPAHGAASVAGDLVTYTPNAGYSGSDSFTWTATGPGGTSAATVTLTVAGPARPEIDTPADPVVVPPSAGGSGSVSIDLGSVSQGPIDGYRITAVSQFGVAEVTNGAAAAPMQARASAAPQAAGPYRLVYTPAANFMGEDTVTVVAYGPGGDSAPVTFTFQVAGKAPDLSAAVLAGASVNFTPTAGLVGGPFQALRITSAPGFGTATVNGLGLVFTPGANGGTTAFDYVVDLPFGASAPGRVSLTSNAMPGSEALVARTLQGVPVTVRVGGVAGGPFTGAAVVSMAPATAGEATIAKVGDDYDLTFVSTGDFAGEVVVTYSLSNASGPTNSTLTVTVEARPDPSLDPEVRGVATSQVTAARRFADAQINNFQQRLRDLHDGTNGSSNGLSLNLGLGGAEADRDPQQALRRQLGQDRGFDPGALGGDRDREMLGLDLWAGRTQSAATVGANDQRLGAASTQPATGEGASIGLWTSGSVDWGRQDATGQRDGRFTTQGATLGLDVKVSDQLIVGGGLGYGEDKTRIGDNGSVTNGKAFTGALYASWRPAEAFYVDGVLGYANLDFTSRRWVEGLAGQADGYADGDRSGDVRFASTAFGRVVRGERVTSDFYARLDARDITLDGFTETGGGLSALNWDEIGQKSVSANLGASWRWTLDSRRYGRFVPTARVEWSHEFEDIGAQGVRYADWATSPTYLVPLNAWSRNAINLNLGTEWSLSDRLMLSLGYRGALGDASTSHGAQIGMKYGW
ncbi:MAG: IPT/TIG domain-containing protein [Brevundimonas sp.]